MPHLRVCVLGSLQIQAADRPVTSPESEKARALLAYLVAEADRPHRREKLVGLLWPDSPEDLARGNLRQALYSLRQAIGDASAAPPYLLISRDEIQFNMASDCSVDLAVFEDRLKACDRHNHGHADACDSCAALLEQALAQYRGRFLDQFFLKDSAEFEEWALVRRESLHRRALEALERLADYHLNRGEHEEATRYAQRQTELDPWREEAQRQLMRALAAGGQRSAALAQYEACRRALREELGVEPSAETRELYGQIGRGEAAAERGANSPGRLGRPSLPAALTPFVGRERELAELTGLLRDDGCRLVTLVGPGGIGKTRLALESAARQAGAFADGAAFVSLASISSPGAVLPAMAGALGFSSYGSGDPYAQILAFLRNRHILLVIDNVEQLLEASDLWVEILHDAPRVKLLLTSRESLNLQGECVLEVEGLPVPESDRAGDIEDYPAAALFLERARRACVGFEVRPEERPAVARLCRVVGGIPLALELAATWVRTLSCGEIVEEVVGSLDFLSVSIRDLPERHRSMRAVFDQSWKMLVPEEQLALARLSIFHGGFTRAAVEQVAGASLPVLSALVAKSLLRRAGAGRFGLHELVRQYSASRLAADPAERQKTGERHALYYLDLLGRRDAALRSSRQKEALGELTSEIDNLRAAWLWAAEYGDASRVVQASFTLWYLFELHNWFLEGERLFRRAAEALSARAVGREPDDRTLQDAISFMLAHAGYFACRGGKNQEAYVTLAASAAHLRRGANARAASFSLTFLGVSCWQLGRFAEARESLSAALAAARATGDPWNEVFPGEFLGIVAHELGEYEEARRDLGDALRIARKMTDSLQTTHVLSYLCRTLVTLGEHAEAEKLLHESLALAREIGYGAGEGLALDALGQVALATGRNEEAGAFFAAANLIFREMGATVPLSRALCHQGLNALALGDTAVARDALTAALRIAYADGLIASTLDALAGLASLAAAAGVEDCERALEITMQVLDHPAGRQEAKIRAARLREGLEAKLTSGQIDGAQRRARSKALEVLVEETLAAP